MRHQEIAGAAITEELGPYHPLGDDSALGRVRDQRLNGNRNCQSLWGDAGKADVVPDFSRAAAAFFPGNHPPLMLLLEHWGQIRSEEHTSELQSLRHLVCRLL